MTNELNELVDIDANRLGGKPCIKGHRISVAQLLAEIADRGSLTKVIKDFDLEEDVCKNALIWASIQFNKKFT